MLHNIFSATLAFLFRAGVPAAVQGRIDLETYDPVSTLVVPEQPLTHASFPFVDVHSRQGDMRPGRLQELVRAMDTLNMRVMVNLSGGNGESLQQKTAAIQQHFPGRFLVFANIDFDGIGSENWTRNAVRQLEEDVRNGAAGLKIFKNLGFSVNDRSGRRVPVDDPRLDPIWKKCGELNIPVLIHTADPAPFWEEPGEKDRKSVVSGKSVSVRVALGGNRIIKKKKITKKLKKKKQ